MKLREYFRNLPLFSAHRLHELAPCGGAQDITTRLESTAVAGIKSGHGVLSSLVVEVGKAVIAVRGSASSKSKVVVTR